jgi:hypothetical protein
MITKHMDALIAHLKTVTDANATPKVGFEMMQYYNTQPAEDWSGHDCGTTACVAGHACLLGGAVSEDQLKNIQGTDTDWQIRWFDLAREWLGLDEGCYEDDAMFLFGISPEGR